MDAGDCTEHAFVDMPGGSAFDRGLAYAKQVAARENGTVAYLCKPNQRLPLPGEITRVTEDEWSVGTLLSSLARLAGEDDVLVYAFADEPFLDAEITEKLIADHRRYYAEYTFSEGRPGGTTPQVLSRRALETMLTIVKSPEDARARNSLFSVIEIDINRFDIETEIAPRDQALLRLSFNTKTKRDALLCSRFAAHEPAGAQELADLVEEKPELRRTLPAYVQVEIINGCPQACSYCPFPLFGGDILSNRDAMPLERFEEIAQAVARFAPSSTLSVSLWGEPGLHPAIVDIVRLVDGMEELSLLVETSGVGWSKEATAALASAALDNTTWIVSLDALDPEHYRQVRGNGYEEAVRFAETFIEAYPASTYVQAVRLRDYERLYPEFWKAWKEKTPNVIIQKYDHVSGKLPERKTTDLSPLTRLPCVHNQRDLVVRLDGTVPLCKEDINGERVLGNIFDDGIEAIWRAGETCFHEHISGAYKGLCIECDEYYTYNF